MRQTTILIAIIAVLVLLLTSMYIVDQKEQAVVTFFGDPVRVVINPVEDTGREQILNEMRTKYESEGIKVSEGAGLHFRIPFVHRVRKFERRLLRWNGNPEQIPTKDKRYIWVDSTARWYIKDPLQFLRSVGTEEEAQSRLDDIIDSSTRNSITKRDIIEIVRTDARVMQVAEEELQDTANVGQVTEGRAQIMAEISRTSQLACEKMGIGIRDNGVLLKGLSYVEDVKIKVEDRMIEERQRIAKKYTSEGEGEYERIMGEKERDVKTIISEAYKEAQQIEGGADAEAAQIYADAYGVDPEFYRFWKTLELYEQYIGGSKTKLILGTDNPLFGLIKGDFSQIAPAETTQ